MANIKINEEKRPAAHWENSAGKNILDVLTNDIGDLFKEKDAWQLKYEKLEDGSRKKTEKNLLFIIELLESIERYTADYEERNTAADSPEAEFIDKLKRLQKIINRQLRSEGVKKIESPSGMFIDGFYEMEKCRPAEGLANDTILEELEKGYLWNNNVLRKAKVIVVKNN